MASAYYLALTWAAYPFIKVVHELGHALAVRRWGGEVHEFGITFFVFTPAPYVDASAASAFRERWQRAAVSAAGIMAELLIGAAALFIWLAVEPGLLSDVAFVVLFVCASSSLLFNGNPLLRFDGYYVLCDLLETPNLAARSHAYWLHLLHRAVGGDAASAPTCARGELKWLVLYAPASWLYRLTLCAALVLWAGAKSAILGWLGAALLLVFVIARPMYAMLRALWRSFAPGGERRRAGACIAGAAALVGAALLGVPVPDSVTAQGVVSPPEAATVRAESEGFVSALLAADGDFVEVGTPLVVLREPAVLTEREALQARLQGLLARQYDAIVRDPAQARNVMEEIERTRIELARAEQRIAQWTVRSKTAGRLVIPHAEDLPGSFVPQGGVLAYVLVPVAPQVRAALAQEHAARLRGAVSRVEVWLADARTRVPAHVVREVPAATRLLPSAALGEPAGGVHAVEPTDKQGTLALEPVFLFDVALAGGTLERLGQRAWVRFDLGTAPLALQWERRARQLLLRHFNPNT
jgi:putative peptide zinc metalloprotease protein